MVKQSKIAQYFSGEPNPNSVRIYNWRMSNQALSKTATKYSYSYYGYKSHQTDAGSSVLVYRPSSVTARDFGLNIPSNAYIKRIQFNVRMKAMDKIDVELPYACLCVYGSAYKEKYSENNGYSTGFYDGFYLVNNHNKITSTWNTYSFAMTEDVIKKAKIKASDLNKSLMGIDLHFKDLVVDSKTLGKGKVEKLVEIGIGYIELEVTYDVPQYTLNHTEIKTTGNNLFTTSSILETTLTFNQSTKANGKYQNFKIETDWGTEILEATSSTSTYTPSTGIWKVGANGISEHKLKLKFQSHVGGYNEIRVIKQYDESNTSSTMEVIPTYRIGYNVARSIEDYNEIKVTFDNEPHEKHKCKVHIDVDGTSNDGAVVFSITELGDVVYTSVSLDPNLTSDGVTLVTDITSFDTHGGDVGFTVPVNEHYSIGLDLEFYPTDNGDYEITVESSDTGTYTFPYTVAEPYTYYISNNQVTGENQITLNPSELYVTSHKVITNIDGNIAYYECVADENDTIMYDTGCEVNAYIQEKQAYIGIIPLEQTHFDPKSTFKDKLLDNHYKNNRYMGKELAPDEDITLNVRLHPAQVTTLQSLIKMDKPIPINTNPKSFEGDALNHRGWAEIYSIKSERTNPHWYKCDIDVKYLSHHLLSRFKIQTGAKSNSKSFNNIMVDALESGDAISTEVFDVETDGTYLYIDDEDVTPSQRNQFSIANGQSIRIRSKNKLSNVSTVNCEWSSELIESLNENNVSRIFRLIDANTNESVFEYEYTDYEYYYDGETLDSVDCNTIYRVLDKGDYDSVENEINLRTEFGTGSNDDNSTLDNELSSESEPCYGSTLRFALENNKLTVIDEGFSSREVYQEDIPLEGKEYLWECEWINNNTDENLDDIIAYFDITMSDTILNSKYSGYYGNMIVSPFPVADKKLLFTRKSEEGVIYYLEDDGEEFSYLIDPYYQYHCGTDLKTADGVSILNWDYDYNPAYIQNGLVRLGINRFTGHIYLAKYDNHTKQYITTHHFHLDKYNDININSITDDKIVVQVSDCIFTIWRGHPYIAVKHRTEDLILDTKIDGVWAEAVGNDDFIEYPSYWDLMNNSNLLDNVKKSDLTVTADSTEDGTSTSLSWNDSVSPTTINTDYTFKVTGTTTTFVDNIELESHNGAFGYYEVDIS